MMMTPERYAGAETFAAFMDRPKTNKALWDAIYARVVIPAEIVQRAEALDVIAGPAHGSGPCGPWSHRRRQQADPAREAVRHVDRSSCSRDRNVAQRDRPVREHDTTVAMAFGVVERQCERADDPNVASQRRDDRPTARLGDLAAGIDPVMVHVAIPSERRGCPRGLLVNGRPQVFPCGPEPFERVHRERGVRRRVCSDPATLLSSRAVAHNSWLADRTYVRHVESALARGAADYEGSGLATVAIVVSGGGRLRARR